MKRKKKINSEDDVSGSSPKGRRVSRAESSRRRRLETCGHAGSWLLLSLFLFVCLFIVCLFVFAVFCCFSFCLFQDLQPFRLVSLVVFVSSIALSLFFVFVSVFFKRTVTEVSTYFCFCLCLVVCLKTFGYMQEDIAAIYCSITWIEEEVIFFGL